MSGMPVGPYVDFAREKLGFEYNNIQLLITALTHRSYVNEHKKSVSEHNERLEFLGDAVLDLVVSEWLFRAVPDLNEGTMTQARAAVVCERSLAGVARQLRLGDYLLLGRGERSRNGDYPDSILADALEALIGAIHVDGGIGAVRVFLERILADELVRAQQGSLVQDYKSQLQQELQKVGPRSIVYQLISQSGPPHNRLFTVEVWVDGEVLGSGSGKSKKEAEQLAAQAALAMLG